MANADLSALEPPILLLAMPQVLDPYFHKTVILLVAHEDEGSLGFIVNRPTEIRVAEVLQTMEIQWAGESTLRTFFGGPVRPQLGTVLYATGPATEGGSEILPGIALTQHVGDLTTLAAEPPSGFRLLLGYAGWGAGQLVDEIRRNDWLTAPASPNLVFAEQPETAWDEALRSVGIDPAALPSWTAPSDDEAAN